MRITTVQSPFRLPGTYISPAETGFYLAGTRYYDPEIGRFINADSVISGTGESVQGYNLFAYCFNNPINMSDPTGNWPKFLKEIGSRVVNAVKIMSKIIISPLKAISGKIGIGMGIGGKIDANISEIPVDIGAIASVTDSLVLDNGKLDAKNSSTANLSINALDIIEYNLSIGEEHSYFDNNCSCNFLHSTFSEKNACSANKKTITKESTIGFSLSAYFILGFDISIGIDLNEWGNEVIAIFNESLSYN